MRVQTEEWRRFIPGVRMYKGKMTLFWNGQPLGQGRQAWEEQQKWEVIIVLPGVKIIPEWTFFDCKNVKTVIMSDTVQRIGNDAFNNCYDLEFVKLSRNLEYIGEDAFKYCFSLASIFIPPSCRVIGNGAFDGCEKLNIFSVSYQTQLGENVIADTALVEASPFPNDETGFYENSNEVNEWIKNRHQHEQFSLHRACASYNPLEEVIFGIIRRQGVKAFKQPDSVGVTPSQYLSENPFADLKEQKIIKRYILDMMGEVI